LFKVTISSFFLASDASQYVQSLDISELKDDFESQNLIIWSCTLKHTLTYSNVLSYFVIIKTLETLFKTHFGSTLRACLDWLILSLCDLSINISLFKGV